ncbi:MAG: hypothetical protein LUD16_01600 [Lachnospiraceae bacterium]|nr:hypothetical protein [Lachnospiraceae bacterium]
MKYEEDARKVIDVDTSTAPEGKAAQEVSDGKNRLLQILKYFNWGVLLCDRRWGNFFIENYSLHW